MAWNRFRKMAKQRRQYTLTRTKAVISFCLSVFFSMMLGPYFERYGGALIKEFKASIWQAKDDPKEPAKVADNPSVPPSTRRAPEVGLQERLRQLGRHNDLFNFPKRVKEPRERKKTTPEPESSGTF